MTHIFGKITPHEKRVALFVGLFLAIFIALFFIVNLDLKPAKKSSLQTNSAVSVGTNEELNKRLGSTTVSMESYEDWLNRFDVYPKNRGLDVDIDKDSLPNYLEYVYGTNPLKADSDVDKFSDKQEIINGYDPDAPGSTRPTVEISISKIDVAAPMVWSKSEKEKEMLAELELGVSHYNKTASPGQVGNMIISGHSSNYIWAKGNYNHVFKDLNDLKRGDIVIVKTMQKNGRVIVYKYKITDKFITTPNDAEIFEGSTVPVLTLSTCWPLGTNLKRVIVKAVLE